MLYKNQLLKAKMAERNISVDEVARIAKKKVSKNTISAARNGRDIRVSKLAIIATAIGVPMAELFEKQ